MPEEIDPMETEIEEQLSEDSAPEVEQLDENSETTEGDLYDVGGENVTIEELKSGYQRYGDYTQKTQRLADEKREWEETRDVTGRERDLTEAERRKLSEFERVDSILTNDPNRAQKFNELIKGVDFTAKPEDPRIGALEGEIKALKEREASRSETEEDRLIALEMEQVTELVGQVTRVERDEFFKFVEELQDEVEGTIPLPKAARMFHGFDEKRLNRLLDKRETDKTERNKSKAKTKTAGGRKAAPAAKSKDASFLEDLQRAFEGKKITE